MTRFRAGPAERRSVVTAVVGLLLLVGAFVSAFVIGSFWNRHAMLTSLVANLLVVVVTVAVVNQALERRDRRRWSLHAQSALFSLLQSARLTWTSMLEVLGLAEVQTGSPQSLQEGAVLALDRARVSAAADDLLAAPEQRRRLQFAVEHLSDHASAVIARWADVLVGAAPYAGVLDRHVELQGRLEWLNASLAYHEPPPDQEWQRRRLIGASVASEHAAELGEDFARDMIVAITHLSAALDDESRDLAFSLVPAGWWAQRTRSLADT